MSEVQTPIPLALASRNPHKLAELKTLLAGLPLGVRSAAELGLPEVIEDGVTFADNALLKAASAWRLASMAALADDSGLAVDALDGAPGVHSARFAGEDADDAANNQRLLERLSGLEPGKRGAAFHCTMALLLPERLVGDARSGEGWVRSERTDIPKGAALYFVRGHVRGRILEVAHGAGGFGYDPLFLYEPTGVTFAEMAGAPKHAVSHRGVAMTHLRRCLAAVLS